MRHGTFTDTIHVECWISAEKGPVYTDVDNNTVRFPSKIAPRIRRFLLDRQKKESEFRIEVQVDWYDDPGRMNMSNGDPGWPPEQSEERCSLNIYLAGVIDLTHLLCGDFEMVRRCDCIYMLPGWRASLGAQLERDVAIKDGILVFYHSDEERVIQEFIDKTTQEMNDHLDKI